MHVTVAQLLIDQNPYITRHLYYQVPAVPNAGVRFLYGTEDLDHGGERGGGGARAGWHLNSGLFVGEARF